MKVSVILCTHNPREDYLDRALKALREQTLPQHEWELLLVDNASDHPVAPRFDLSWHPNGRHIVEPTLGKIKGWLHAIPEAAGDILIFVDDDNLLDADYLEQAIVISTEWPFVGAWGGSVVPELETPLPEWCKNEAWRLAITEVKEDVWSNLREGFATVPVGAGMCIRKTVGARYQLWCGTHAEAQLLDRSGTLLAGYGDIDLAHCALDIGLGTGKSTRLRLTHLIPAKRVNLDYFVRHAEGDTISFMMFRAIRNLPQEKKPDPSLIERLRWFLHCKFARIPRETLEMQKAHRRGTEKGWKLVEAYRKSHMADQAKGNRVPKAL